MVKDIDLTILDDTIEFVWWNVGGGGCWGCRLLRGGDYWVVVVVRWWWLLRGGGCWVLVKWQ